MDVVELTDMGLVRTKNQDSIFASNQLELPLFIIADGMGGHNGGEIASRDAIEIIKNIFLDNKSKLTSKNNIKKVIEESIQKANKNIYKKSIELLEYSGMGTTVSLAYIYESSIYIGHVGDSRIYIVSEDKIKQITEDHSLVNELIKRGEISKEEAEHHPKKNIITRAVGTSRDIEIDVQEYKYSKAEKLLLCSDGLSNMISEIDILNISNKKIKLLQVGQELIDTAKKNGGYDNISLIMVEL